VEPQLIVLDNDSAVEELAQYLQDKEFIAYDCETTGLTEQDEVIGYSICAEEGLAYYIILASWDKVNSRLVYYSTLEASKKLIKSLVGKSLIMHNSVFDCIMAKAFFKTDLMPSLHTDTMVLAHLLDENRRVGLKELSASIFGESSKKEQEEMKASVAANGGSLTKASYEMYKADPYLMGKYGAKDALLTFKLFHTLVPQLFEQDLDKFFYEEETMPLLRGPTYDLNRTGLAVDVKGLASLKKQLEAECLEAKTFIHQEIASIVSEKYPGTNKKNHFNIGSSSQLSWLLFGKLMLEYSVLTKEGKTVCKALGLRLPYTFSAKREFIATCERMFGEIYQPEAIVNGKKVKAKRVKAPWSYIACDKATLAKLAPRYEWIKKLLEYQRKTKILNTYVEGIQERTRYGIIHPSFLQHGTTSGRYSSRNPNFQNLPRDDKRIKGCIQARPGRTFVGADYSQLEPRVFAYFSNDERLLQAFRGTDDFYSVIGMEVYGKTDCTPQKEGSPDAFGIKYKRLRDLSKVIALASTYGATASKLASTTGKSVEDTQLDIDNYFERFPGVKEMMLDSHKQAKKNGVVYNLFGRPRRMPEAKHIPRDMTHAELPYDARNVLNLAVNHRIQSTGASIVNRAAIRLYANMKQLGIDGQIVVQVHDSLIVECPEADAEDVAVLMQDAMENTTVLKGIALEAVPKTGKTLANV
jgi:DNA polymerase-1